MKFSFLLKITPLSGTLLTLAGCAAPTEVAGVPKPTATLASRVAPTNTPLPLKIVRSGRPSLPALPQMMDNSPRPTYVPLPTPKVRPGQTIIVSNGPSASVQRESPTIIVSNAPVAGTQITPQVAAQRGLVWVNRKTQIYHRPGSKWFGGTVDGFYLSEAQAQSQGFRAAKP